MTRDELARNHAEKRKRLEYLDARSEELRKLGYRPSASAILEAYELREYLKYASKYEVPED